MDRSPLDSTAVRSAGYDEETRVLEIEFSTGRIYQFDGVPLSVYQWLLRTPSKGGFVTRMINSRYPYRDITRAAVTPTQEDLLKVLSDSVRRLEDKPRK